MLELSLIEAQLSTIINLQLKSLSFFSLSDPVRNKFLKTIMILNSVQQEARLYAAEIEIWAHQH